jgi:hypothetical protein
MNVRRKSLHRKRNCKHAKRRANQRAAKARKRIERATAPIDHSIELAAADRCPMPAASLRFRITIECLSDGERATFTTAEVPFGWTVSPTLCGQKVAKIISHYRPA